MRFRNLDLNLLAALDALCRHRNVSRAAEELFISQSALSNALGRLREYFNDPLLIQIGRKMELSPLAANLSAQVRDILVQVETATSTARAFDPAEVAQRITLIVSDYSLHTVIPPFLAAVARQAPGLTFDIRAQQTLPHLLLERGEADLLLAPLPFCSLEHPTERLFADDFCCVVDAARPNTGDRLTREDFETSGHIVMQPPNGGGKLRRASVPRGGADPAGGGADLLFRLDAAARPGHEANRNATAAPCLDAARQSLGSSGGATDPLARVGTGSPVAGTPRP
jgi:LysR family transcriptional regulator, nod-box dependent transcriptional activator